MKTYEEMAAAVFARRDAWMARRQRRRKAMLRAGGLSALSAALIAGAIALPARLGGEFAGSDPGDGSFHGMYNPKPAGSNSDGGRTTDRPATSGSGMDTDTTSDSNGEDIPSPPPETVLRGYEEYQRYVEEQGLPEDILPYERIAAIGELTELHIPVDRYNHSYLYLLTDEVGQRVCLQVFYDPYNGIEGDPMPEDIVQFADLRSIDDEFDRMYQYGDCIYDFQSGMLSAVYWRAGNWTFYLTGNLYRYPYVYNTFTAGLLCANTAKETFARLDLTGLPDYPDLLGFERKGSTK